MTYENAVDSAKSGLRITRPGKPAWIEYDEGAKCLTVHNGQPHRVRWAPFFDDVKADDWLIVPDARLPEITKAELVTLIQQLIEARLHK